MSINYHKKYLKYKEKYLISKTQNAGGFSLPTNAVYVYFHKSTDDAYKKIGAHDIKTIGQSESDIHTQLKRGTCIRLKLNDITDSSVLENINYKKPDDPKGEIAKMKKTISDIETTISNLKTDKSTCKELIAYYNEKKNELDKESNTDLKNLLQKVLLFEILTKVNTSKITTDDITEETKKFLKDYLPEKIHATVTIKNYMPADIANIDSILTKLKFLDDDIKNYFIIVKCALGKNLLLYATNN